jgi:hypothetical protein
MIEIDTSTSVHHKDSIGVDNRVQSMRNCQNCAFVELRSDRLLYKRVGLIVVEYQNAVLFQ